MAVWSAAPAAAARFPFYYGWVVAGVLGIVSFSSVAFTPALIGLFFRDMALEFGWSLTLLSGAQLAGSLIALFLSPVAGRLHDRYGSRVVLTTSVAIIGLCLFLMGLITNPVMYYIVLGLGVGVVIGPIRISPAATIAQWFVRSRGVATGFLGIGIAVGFATLPLLGALVSAAWGWRAGWWAIGAVVLAVALPACFFFLLRHPSDVGQHVDGDQAEDPPPTVATAGRTASTEVQWTAGEAMRTPALWLLVLSTSLIVLTFMGLSTHLTPFLVGRGLSPSHAAIAINIGGIAAIGYSVAWGWLMDRTPVRYSVAATGASIVLLIVVMAAAGPVWTVVPIGLVWGVGAASTGTVIRAVFAYYFGRRSAGTILGIVTPFRVVSQGSGILVAGVIFDLTGSYAGAFYLFAALSVIAIFAALFTPTPRKGMTSP